MIDQMMRNFFFPGKSPEDILRMFGAAASNDGAHGELMHPEMFPCVYVVEAIGLNLVKIGFASKPSRRFLTIKTCCPVPVRFLCVLPGGAKTERRLHRLHRQRRVSGEWFRFSSDEIAALLSYRRVFWKAWNMVALRIPGHPLVDSDGAQHSLSPQERAKRVKLVDSLNKALLDQFISWPAKYRDEFKKVLAQVQIEISEEQGDLTNGDAAI